MPRIAYPNGDTNANPLLVVDPDEVAAWLRHLADSMGLHANESRVFQSLFTDKDGKQTIIWDVPELTLMTSNIRTGVK